jgi:hypothetical protein
MLCFKLLDSKTLTWKCFFKKMQSTASSKYAKTPKMELSKQLISLLQLMWGK